MLLAATGCGRDTRSAQATPLGVSPPTLEPLAAPAPPGSAEPNLAVDGGRAYLSWLEPTPDSGHALRFATLENGAWSPPRTVAQGKRFFVNWADFPSLHVLGGGRLAAHWLERSGDTGSYEVRVALSNDGGATWGRPITPHRDASAAEHGFVSLWSVGDTLAIAWLDGRKYARIPIQEEAYSKEMMLLSTTINPDGSLGQERRIDERTCDCCQTSVATTSRGPLVAYRDRTTDEIRDIQVSRFERSYWTPPKVVHADGWKVDYCPVNGPAVAASGDRAAVAWFTAARDSARVQVAFSADAGDSFGAPVRVDAGAPAGRVGAVMLEDGAVLVSWIERTGGEQTEVRARRVHPDGTMDAPFTVAASSAARASGFPRIAALGDTIVLAWTEPGSASVVRSARAVVSRGAEGGR